MATKRQKEIAMAQRELCDINKKLAVAGLYGKNIPEALIRRKHELKLIISPVTERKFRWKK